MNRNLFLSCLVFALARVAGAEVSVGIGGWQEPCWPSGPASGSSVSSGRFDDAPTRVERVAACPLDERFETVDVSRGALTVESGETREVTLFREWRFVRTIYLDVRGSSPESGLVILVNGSPKPLALAGGSVVVAVNEVVRQLEIRVTSAHRVEIERIRAIRSSHVVDDFECVAPEPSIEAPPTTNVAVWISSRALRVLEALRPHLDPQEEYVDYVLPIKTAAERAEARAKIDGDLSTRTQDSLLVLAKAIVHAEPVLASLLRKEDDSASLAKQLISLHDEIENRVR